MVNSFTSDPPYGRMTAERSERAVLLEQVRHLRNLYKQVGNMIAQNERRLAEIERETVERERLEMSA